jgi:pimeloyl-ACP methyl ester carboxylesterase
VNSLMHAIDHYRRPRTESVLTTRQLAAISIPVMFIWGTDAPYLSASSARPWIGQIPAATLHQVPGGHGPWLADTKRTAELIQNHLTSTTATQRSPRSTALQP